MYRVSFFIHNTLVQYRQGIWHLKHKHGQRLLYTQYTTTIQVWDIAVRTQAWTVEEKCSKLEDELFIQNGVINKLKDELTKRSDALNQEEELLQLSSEVRPLKEVNEEKEIELANISKEYQEVKAKLKEIESESLRFQDKSLKDELCEQLGTNLKCNECHDKFRSTASLKMHMKSVHGMKVKMRMYKMEKQILEQQ